MITNKFICEIFFYDSTHLLIVFAKTSKTPFCRWNDKLMNFVNEYLQRNNNNVILGQFRQHFKIFTQESFLCVCFQVKFFLHNAYVFSKTITLLFQGNFDLSISRSLPNNHSCVCFQVKSFLQKSCLSLSLKTLRAFAFAESFPDDQLKPMNSAKFAFVPGKGRNRDSTSFCFIIIVSSSLIYQIDYVI